ncbi:MAG: 50S ribosomal protein L6 [Acidobacteria bacterium]|nr:50S ribosomal protein L6 [Acidobacteriota bacterium]
MSRIGKKPIQIPKGVQVAVGTEHLEVKGPKGSLQTPIPAGISFKVEDGWLKADRAGDDLAALHGLARALAANAIQGVSQGFSKELLIVGVGYKAELKGKTVVFSLGYSHPIEFPIPEDLNIAIERRPKQIDQYQMSLVVSGSDKQRVGQVAAHLRNLRKPDPYKGKGIRYADEVLRLKPGKAGTKAG